MSRGDEAAELFTPDIVGAVNDLTASAPAPASGRAVVEIRGVLLPASSTDVAVPDEDAATRRARLFALKGEYDTAMALLRPLRDHGRPKGRRELIDTALHIALDGIDHLDLRRSRQENGDTAQHSCHQHPVAVHEESACPLCNLREELRLWWACPDGASSYASPQSSNGPADLTVRCRVLSALGQHFAAVDSCLVYLSNRHIRCSTAWATLGAVLAPIAPPIAAHVTDNVVVALRSRDRPTVQAPHPGAFIQMLIPLSAPAADATNASDIAGTADAKTHNATAERCDDDPHEDGGAPHLMRHNVPSHKSIPWASREAAEAATEILIQQSIEPSSHLRRLHASSAENLLNSTNESRDNDSSIARGECSLNVAALRAALAPQCWALLVDVVTMTPAAVISGKSSKRWRPADGGSKDSSAASTPR